MMLTTSTFKVFLSGSIYDQPPPLSQRRARLFGQHVQEEADGFVHLVHADIPQHLLQEGQSERVVVSPPAVASHRDATWWRTDRNTCRSQTGEVVCICVRTAASSSYCGSSRGCRGGATGQCRGSECPRGASSSPQSCQTGKRHTWSQISHLYVSFPHIMSNCSSMKCIFIMYF